MYNFAEMPALVISVCVVLESLRPRVSAACSGMQTRRCLDHFGKGFGEI